MTKETFKRLREYMGMTQGKYAEELGYNSFRAIMRKESGATHITKQDEMILTFKFPHCLADVLAELQKTSTT